MIIREMPWEKRNLGVNAVSFHVEKGDIPEKMMVQVASNPAEYQEMRIPWGNTDVLLAAQNCGFKVIEMMFDLEVRLDDESLYTPSFIRRFLPYIKYTIADDAEFEDIINAVEKGDMFDTDKISRNPAFGRSKAGKRYAFWLRDARAEGAVTINILYKDKKVGFSSLRVLDDGTYDAFLGGIFPDFEFGGIGNLFNYVDCMFAKEKSAKKCVAHISSNNLSNIKCVLSIGGKITNAEYILYKMTKDNRMTVWENKKIDQLSLFIKTQGEFYNE